jgi:hypothetical protein
MRQKATQRGSRGEGGQRTGNEEEDEAGGEEKGEAEAHCWQMCNFDRSHVRHVERPVCSGDGRAEGEAQ